MTGSRLRNVVVPSLLLLVLLLLVAQQHGLILRSSPGGYTPWAAPVPATATVDLGVVTDPLANNAWRPWTPDELESVNAFEHAARLHVSVVMWFADWEHSSPSLVQLRAVAARHSLPEITWEPWDSTRPHAKQPRYSLQNIIDGRFDAYIRAWARELAAFGRPVRLRFAQEMNGSWYPWAEAANGDRPGEYVRAWDHVHRIFERAGATNVQWVWSPVAGAPRRDFPGIDEVNMLGLTCLNGGTAAFHRGWRSFARICGKSIGQLHRLAPTLPIEISEAASAEGGGDKAAWIKSMFAWLARHPVVKSLVWFNVHKEANWTIQSSAAAKREFALGIASGRYR